MAGGLSYGQGGLTPVRVPSDEAYEQFDTVDSIQGQPDLPSLPVTFRMTRNLSQVYRMARKRCIVDVQLHFGACKNPADFNNGWEKVGILDQSRITTYGTGDLGAMDADQNAPVDENVEFVGQDWYEVVPLTPSVSGTAAITDEVIKVLICDQRTCGECGLDSDGCQNIFAIVSDTSGSPGLNARIMYSKDQGATWSSQVVNSMAAAEVPVDAVCAGPYIVIFSGGSNDRMHYALITEVLRGIAVWNAVATGFVGAGSPSKAYAHNAENIWVTGDGGYIYKITDPTNSASAKTSGDITTQNLKGIHSYDDTNVVAVGASNVVLLSRNGGTSWALQTGPAAGVQMNAVWMTGANSWLIGSNAGVLYFTEDAGLTYTTIGIPDSASGIINDIRFSKRSVGYIGRSMTSNPRAQILRSIDGGYSWFKAEGKETMPLGQTINSIAACEDNPNLVFGGGLDTALSDGYLVKLS